MPKGFFCHVTFVSFNPRLFCLSSGEKKRKKKKKDAAVAGLARPESTTNDDMSILGPGRCWSLDLVDSDYLTHFILNLRYCPQPFPPAILKYFGHFKHHKTLEKFCKKRQCGVEEGQEGGGG